MKKFIIFSIIILAALSSCEKDEGLDIPTMSKHIGYEVSLKDGFRQGKTKSGLDAASELSVCIDEVNGKLREKSLFLHTETQGWKNDTLKTKGSILSSLSGLGISAWLYKENYEAGKPYFENDEHSFAGNTVTTGRYWPQKDEGYSLRFYAYAPLGIVELPPTSGWTDGVPSFNYTVPDNISEQGDLLVASSNVESSAFGNTIQMDFGHALTAVQFMVDEELTDFTINSITISGVKKSGTYTYAYSENGDGNSGTQTHDNGDWTGQEGDGTFTLTFDPGFVCNGREDVLNESEDVLFMMPQDLGAGAKITMIGTDTYNGENTPVTLSAVIGGDGKEWEKGTKVVYKISRSDIVVEYVFNVQDVTTLEDINPAEPATQVSSAAEVPYYGQLGRKYNVESYKKTTRTGGSYYKKLEWRLTDKPDWIDNVSIIEGDGGAIEVTEPIPADAGTYGVIATFQSGTAHNRMKVLNPNGTEESPYDLSTKGGEEPQTTANCYIVDAPGYYKLPLVYGNAIKGGLLYDDSYEYSGESQGSYKVFKNSDETVTLYADILRTFLNYNGEEITSPYIAEDTGIQVDNMDVEVVWQDEPCLVTELRVGSDGYLYFRVREDCICEGNAVLAIKKSDDTILWSWHIWVTDNNDVGSVDIQNNEGNTFSVMKTHIGLCREDTKVYSAREGSIVFKQYENGVPRATVAISVSQAAGTVTSFDNAVYYQYGRKDPFLPAYKLDGGTKDKPYYSDNRDQYTKGYGGGRVGFFIKNDPDDSNYEPQYVNLNDGIKNPGLMYPRWKITDQYTSENITNYRWYNTENTTEGGYNFINLWNANSDIVPMFEYGAGTGISDGMRELIAEGFTKTIYDPSPRGYEMPRVDAFWGFTEDGINKEGTTEGVRVSDFNNNSFTFLDKLQIRALGYRYDIDNSTLVDNGGGSIQEYGNYGAALTSAPVCILWGGQTDYFFQLSRFHYDKSNSVFSPISTSNFSMMFPVIPVKTGANPFNNN